MAAWGATKAKSHFSEVLDRAASEGPQLVTRRKQEFFVLTREQFDKRGNQPADGKTFVSGWDVLRPSFDDRFDYDFPRAKGKTRKVDLG